MMLRSILVLLTLVQCAFGQGYLCAIGGGSESSSFWFDECKTGIYLDKGGYVTVPPAGIVQSFGPTPAVLVDARLATSVDVSTYRAPGSTGPRQSAAIVGATVHVLAGDTLMNALTGEVITGVELHEHVPGASSVVENYPNPFNASTTLSIRIPLHTTKIHVVLSIYDVLGEEIRTILNERLPPGLYTKQFDGSALPSGVYVARSRVGDAVYSRRMLLLR